MSALSLISRGYPRIKENLSLSDDLALTSFYVDLNSGVILKSRKHLELLFYPLDRVDNFLHLKNRVVNIVQRIFSIMKLYVTHRHRANMFGGLKLQSGHRHHQFYFGYEKSPRPCAADLEAAKENFIWGTFLYTKVDLTGWELQDPVNN